MFCNWRAAVARRLSLPLDFMNMHYRDADDAYFKIVEADGPKLFGSIKQSVFPNTYRAMFGFCVKTNSLKTAMFDSIESNNPYAFKILFRCFCEHYLKFMYIWARFVKEKSDAIGIEYYSFCGAIEAQDYVSAISMAECLLGNAAVTDVKQAIASLYPEAAKLTKRELDQKSNQFKYRSILRSLAEESFEFVTKERPFLAQIVPAYALLSSFVHGGPYTDMEMADYSEPKVLADCEAEVEVVFMMVASVFMLSAAAVSREQPEFSVIAANVSRILKEFCGDGGD
jgi:hypothetical protein